MSFSPRVGNRFGAMLLAFASLPLAAQPPALRAPNVVVISPQLVTSGQPSAEVLGRLAAQGFAADIYLAPPTVPDAVKDEALIIARQGLVFVNIPIRFDNPTEADFEAFAGALRGLAGRKVLVHCQVNMRASSMVFLYRSIVAKEDPRIAYDAVARVWVPEGPWKRLIQEQLHKHKIDFELF
jgi:protein tyrosine phosphatase (PTP) superfamily phosphohydrolase (DUF442 family)